jgi:hypothetical protein
MAAARVPPGEERVWDIEFSLCLRSSIQAGEPP